MTITDKPVDNGVNTEALLGARNALTEQPAGGRVHLAGNMLVGARHPQHARPSRDSPASARSITIAPTYRFDVDHPECFASEDLGATPVEYVLVGLAGCLTAGVAAVAQNRNDPAAIGHGDDRGAT